MKHTHVATLAWLLAACSCGGPRPPAPTTAPPPTEPGPPPPTAERLDEDLPALPQVETPAPAERAVPPLTTLAELRTALDAGFYDAVRRALQGVEGDATEKMALRDRLDLRTGHYDELIARGAEVSSGVVHRTSVAEAMMARGRLEEAERVLIPLARLGEGRRARLLLGRLYTRTGRDAEARGPLMGLIEEYNDERIGSDDAAGLALVAQAAALLGSPHDANDAFRESARAAETRAETQVAWSRFFLEHYDAGHAEEGLRIVLEHNPNHPEALASMARVKLDQSLDFDAARELLERALAQNGNLAMAWVTRAGIALRDMDLDAATAAADRALEIDPSSSEALAVRGATRYLADDEPGYRAMRERALALDPGDARFFVRVGEFADWEHRYPFEVSLGREATRVDPEDASGWALLGNNLLRTGEEQEGLSALREAWERDHFNVRVYNTLNLYDDEIGPHYVDFPRGPFIFRMHREERPVLERYVPQLLDEAYSSMRERYHFTPEGPVRIELYARSGDFSVRTAGLPNAGVQGVCFGKVVTALSPRAGPFNWGQITWHELSHVFHIQLSRNRVPRWFTEGLAEYETLLAGKGWRREQDGLLYRALRSGSLPALAEMNHAFTHARSGEAMTAAYYASSQIVKYMGERFGFDALVAMLRLWGERKSTEEVFEGALHQTVAQVDAAFRADALRRMAARAADFGVDFGRYTELEGFAQAAQRAPGDAHALAEHAAALLVHGEVDAASARVEEALGIDAGEGTALFLSARLHLMRGDAAGAKAAIDALLAHHDGYDLRLMAGRAALASSDRAGAKAHLERARVIDPDRSEALAALLDLAREDHDDDARRELLEAAAALDEHSREVSGELLDLLLAQQRWPELVRFGEASRYVDPERAASHRALAEAYLHTGRPQDALYELDTAALLAPDDRAAIDADRARAQAAIAH